MSIFSNEGIIILMVIAGCWMFVLGPAIDRLVASTRAAKAGKILNSYTSLSITTWGNLFFIPLLLGVFVGRMFSILGM